MVPCAQYAMSGCMVLRPTCSVCCHRQCHPAVLIIFYIVSRTHIGCAAIWSYASSYAATSEQEVRY
eukprot:1807814-Rhodomonas_salina.5